MTKVVIREPTHDDITTLMSNMRDADRAELTAVVGKTHLEKSLHLGLEASMLSWAGDIDGELTAVFGVSPLSTLGGVGAPWLIGTPVADLHARAFVRENLRYIPTMLEFFPTLINFVSIENRRTIRWLRFLGFNVSREAQPYGLHGELFYQFSMEK